MDASHTGKVIDSKNGFDIIECEQCGFTHITPLPTFEELAEVYQHDYYTKEKPLSIERHIADSEWHNLQYSDRYDTFESHLGIDQRRILDVGSGPGFFLQHGKKRDWEVLGIEPSTQACEHSRGLGVPVVQEFLHGGNAESFGLFDAVHASLVIEHISDPKEFIQNIYTLTKPGGLICITAPNDYNPFQRAVRKSKNIDPWWLCCPHHINYFTPESLSQLLAKCGFKELLRESTFPIDLFLLMDEHYIGNDELGRECHKKRMIFEKNLAKAELNSTKRALYQQLAQLNLGREICLYARREVS